MDEIGRGKRAKMFDDRERERKKLIARGAGFWRRLQLAEKIREMDGEVQALTVSLHAMQEHARDVASMSDCDLTLDEVEDSLAEARSRLHLAAVNLLGISLEDQEVEDDV